jgi:alkylresorcinol/alkylpyrone synthase
MSGSAMTAGDVCLLSISTAVPRYRIAQAEAEAFGKIVFAGRGADFERLLPVYANAGIATRYSTMPIDWLARPKGWRERSRAYREGALDLLQEAACRCLRRAGFRPADVDGIVVASTTGVVTPSLDALLIERLPFRRDVKRLPIFGLGCAGGVLGLARTAAMALAAPGEVWLFLVVELCSLTFRAGDQSKSNIVGSALFGDGAAAALVACSGGRCRPAAVFQGPARDDTRARGRCRPALRRWGEHTWPETLDVMGWHVEDDGLGVLFSRDIPALVRNGLRPRIDDFLAAGGLRAGDVDGWLFHPGGVKVLEALEDCLGLSCGAMRHAREVLRDFGNMSAATVMFVMEKALADGMAGRHLVGALGPGFTAGFLLIETGA